MSPEGSGRIVCRSVDPPYPTRYARACEWALCGDPKPAKEAVGARAVGGRVSPDTESRLFVARGAWAGRATWVRRATSVCG